MSSLHPSAPEIIKSGIFNNVQNFNELKKRIANTKSLNNRGVAKTKGDIFEIFCEAYLTVNKEYQTKKVYPQEATPLSIRKKLNLPRVDDGWDGVYETLDGKFATWQAKFRTQDERLTWQGENGLSSTIAKGQRADIIHLIANVTKVPSSFESSDKVIQTLGNNINNIDKHFFIKIEKWLKNKKYIEEGLHKPDKYQLLALKSIKKELDKKDRATVIMACGSGKTDIGVWEYIRRKPKLALVLVPSIALVKQIRADWLSQIQSKVMTFQLCSSKDTTKKEDAITIKEKDLDMRISTNAFELKRWVNSNKKSNKIIFSTYQSSIVMNSALKNKSVDFAVFDEAHRTATVSGKVDSYFSNSLFDKNIKIKKRLFMTATRRISNQKKVNKEGDKKLSVNMDNPEIYGNICYKLSFTKAANVYKCIAKPKVIISEIFSDEIDNERTRISSTHVDGEKLKSDYLANIIAIKKAVQKYKINKVFTFHNSINSAQRFTTSEDAENVGYYLDNFYTNFIKGTMNMRVRDEIITEFKHSNYGLLANQRCLIEGVDVPSVNMIVFNSPKHSEVDIVQAIGRALRNRGQVKKKHGYILVPILIEKNSGESVSEAIKRTDFDKVAEIINAIKEHDDEIAQIIQEAIISNGRGKGITKRIRKELSDFIDISHPEISKDKLFNSITTKIINHLTTDWDLKIAELLNFKNKFKTFDVYSKPKYINLKKWIVDIRYRWRLGQLYNFQIKQLEEIGLPKYRESVELFETRNLLTKLQISKQTGATVRQLNYLEKRGLIKSEGKGPGRGTKGASNLYKKISAEKLKKLLKVDFFIRGKYETIYSNSNKIGVNINIIKKYIKDAKIKSLGKVLKGDNLYEVYQKIEKKEILKFYNVIEKTKNLYTLGELDKSLINEINYKGNFKMILLNLISDKKIVPVGRMFGSGVGGYTFLYKKITKKEFSALTGVTLFNTKGLLNYTNLWRDLGLKSPHPIEKLITQKKIKPVGSALSNSGTSLMYKPISKKEFMELYKIDFIETDKLENLNTFSKKWGLASHFLIKVFNKIKIKPVGKGISHGGGITNYYKKIKLRDIKNKLKVDFFTAEEKKGLLTLTGLQKLIFKRAYKSNSTFEKLLIANHIKPAGRGYASTGEPVDLYKPISKTMIKKIFTSK